MAHWRDFGFKRDPFDIREAEKMSEDMWQETFVVHHGFEDIILNYSRSSVLFAAPGSGKTAHRLYFARNLRNPYVISENKPSNPLVVNYTDFSAIVSKLPAISLEDHLQSLFSAVANAVFADFVILPSCEFLQQRPVIRRWWWQFLKSSLNLPLELQKQDRTDLYNDFLSFESVELFANSRSPLEILQAVVQMVIPLGFDRIYILIDGVDSYNETQSIDYLEALVSPLFNVLTLDFVPYDQPNFVIMKFFLPDSIISAAEKSWGFRTDRLEFLFLDWDNQKLIELLNLRLRWASKGNINNINEIFAPSFGPTLVSELLGMAQFHKTLGQLRALLVLTDWLLKASQSSLVQLSDWERFVKRAKKVIKPRIFMSYAHADKEFTYRLASDLKVNGGHVWVDFWEIEVGDPMVQKIGLGINSCHYFLIVLSPNSVSSRWVQQELDSALVRQLKEASVKILPVLLTDCERPSFLSDKLYADFRQDYQSGFNSLLRALKLPVGISTGNDTIPFAATASSQPRSEPVHELPREDQQLGNTPAVEELSTEELDRIMSAIEVVIMTATPVELFAVLEKMAPLAGRDKVLQGHDRAETYYLGRFGTVGAAISMCNMGSGGAGGSSQAGLQVMNKFMPKASFMVGIAYGKDPLVHKRADILVATQIIGYEAAKIRRETDFQHRGERRSPNPTLLNRFRNAIDWQFISSDRLPVSIHFGPLLSGEKLIDNPEFKEWLFKQFPEAIGGDMEGYGFAAAGDYTNTPWILVKSVADWADGNKNDQFQALAAKTAVSLLHHILNRKAVLDGLVDRKR